MRFRSIAWFYEQWVENLGEKHRKYSTRRYLNITEIRFRVQDKEQANGTKVKVAYITEEEDMWEMREGNVD